MHVHYLINDELAAEKVKKNEIIRLMRVGRRVSQRVAKSIIAFSSVPVPPNHAGG